MRRSLILFLAVLACSSSFATELTLWHKELSSHAFFQKVIGEFNRSSGHKVSVELIGVDQYKSSLLKMALAKKLPDVAICPADFVGLYHFLRLSKIPRQTIKAEIDNKTLATARVDGVLYGAPIIGGNHLVLYYNRKWVKKPAETWSDLKNQGRALESQGVKTIGWNYQEMYWFAPFVQAFGGQFLDGKKITLDHNAMQQALKFYIGLTKNGVISQDCDYACAAQKFFEGEFAYAINGDWALEDAIKALGKNLGVAPIPRIGQRIVPPMFSSQTLIFPENSLQGPKKKALTQLMEFLQSSSIQKRLFTEAQRIPVETQALAFFRAKGKGFEQSLIETLRQAKQMPSATEMAFAWEGMRIGFKAFLGGRVDAKGASRRMQLAAEEAAQKTQKLFDKE